MKTPRVLAYTVVISLSLMVALAGCDRRAGDDDGPTFGIGVFVPGVVEGSPTYELLVEGVQNAADESTSVDVKVVEGGFNQAQWAQGLTSMAASEEYDLIVSSNPEIPDIVAMILDDFPDQKFLLMDAYYDLSNNVHTVMFNQREQAFLAGHFAGLVTTSDMVEPVEALRAGLLAGQEYPIMNNVIVPAFELGLRTVDPSAKVDFRVLGNWYDAGRAAELASSMYASGSRVILTIAGGGNQGVIASAKEQEAYVVWYDTPGLDEAPGVVIGSPFVALDKAVYERVLLAVNGELKFGEAEILGVSDGYVGFVQDDPLYRRYVSEAVRSAQGALIDSMESGEFYLPMPID